jgi:hypothetical protein
MAVQINGGSDTAGYANVDANFNLNVVTPTVQEEAGFVLMASENDHGTKTGTPLVRSPETDPDFRLRAGTDTLLDSEIFCYANQNTGKHFYGSSTMTMSLAAGFLVTNSGLITTLSTATLLRTWQFFPLFGQQTPIYIEFNAMFTASVATNTTIDFGQFHQSGSTPFAPSDGVYFRATSSGVFGVINVNGVETTSSVFAFTYNASQVYEFLIVLHERGTEFWIDDVLYATIAVPVGNGQPQMSQTAPVAIRHAIGGVAASVGMQFKVANYSVSLGSLATGRPWGQTMSAMGGGMQVQQGATTGGQLSVYAVGAAPAAVTLTASTAPATNNAGGLFLLPAAITAGEADYPMFAYLNPAGTSAIPGKTMVVTGIRINELCVTTVLAGGPMFFCWAIGFGSTASSLATGESSTFGATTTKVARKIPLGSQVLPATAAAGTLTNALDVDFSDSPITVLPGQYLHVILRTMGAVNLTAGAIRGSVTPRYYFE